MTVPIGKRLQRYCEERVILGDISLVLTERCPLRCLHCNFWREPIPKRDELALETVRAVLSDAYDIGFRGVNFTGGEPFLRPDLKDIVEIAAGTGFDHISLNTSGYVLKKDDFRWLSESPVGTLTFSIDGIGEIHDKFRGRAGAFEMLQRAMEQLQGKVNINANLVIHSGNARHISEVGEFLLSNGATFTVQPFEMRLANSSRMKELVLDDPSEIENVIKDLRTMRADERFRNSLLTSSEHIDIIERYLKDPSGVNLPCFVGYARPHVAADGSVFPCYPLGKMGNVLEKSFLEIWNSEEYERVRPAMLRRDCPNCLLNCYTRINLANMRRYRYEPLLRALDRFPALKNVARRVWEEVRR
ncbi:MAG: radical SAM protein [Deltaproteobacteria bacterium]|nr:radical SAM protein [Deltaproteobacteria bacterium]